MKVFFLLLICCLQQLYTNASLALFEKLSLGPECISLAQLYKATQTMCGQRENSELWGAVIECHRPMTDEFMRANGEAQCPLPKYVLEPNNTAYSIEDVFYNICGIVEGSWWEFAKVMRLQQAKFINFQTGYCVVSGSSDPYITTHSDEVERVKTEFGPDVPCNVGKCVLNFGLGN